RRRKTVIAGVSEGHGDCEPTRSNQLQSAGWRSHRLRAGNRGPPAEDQRDPAAPARNRARNSHADDEGNEVSQALRVPRGRVHSRLLAGREGNVRGRGTRSGGETALPDPRAVEGPPGDNAVHEAHGPPDGLPQSHRGTTHQERLEKRPGKPLTRSIRPSLYTLPCGLRRQYVPSQRRACGWRGLV